MLPPRVDGRYFSFILRETARAAYDGRYERLFWLTDRWPALVKQEVFSAQQEWCAGEGVLHLACRATAPRCVQLCLEREVGTGNAFERSRNPLESSRAENRRYRVSSICISVGACGGSTVVPHFIDRRNFTSTPELHFVLHPIAAQAQYPRLFPPPAAAGLWPLLFGEPLQGRCQADNFYGAS